MYVHTWRHLPTGLPIRTGDAQPRRREWWHAAGGAAALIPRICPDQAPRVLADRKSWMEPCFRGAEAKGGLGHGNF